MTFSAKPLSKGFQLLLKQARQKGEIRSSRSSGPAELNSPYGGIFFYGIHQVDCVIEALGTKLREVFLHRISPTDGVAVMPFQNGAVASLHLLSGENIEFRWSALADGTYFELADKPDPLFYAKSANLIYDFLASGTSPFTRERMLAPIAALEGLQESLKRGTAIAIKSKEL